MRRKNGDLFLEPIDPAEIERLIDELDATADEIMKASRRALQSTARTVAVYSSSELSKALLLPLRIVKSRIRPYAARKKSGEYYRQAVVMYAYPFPESLRGPGKEPDNPDAFRGGGGKGALRRRVWSRQGNLRHPLFQEVIDALDKFEVEAAGLTSMVIATFRRKLISELKYVAGKRRND